MLEQAAINAKNRKTAFKAFREGQKKGSPQKRLKDAQLTKILDLFCANNQPIEHYLCNDMGVKLMAMAAWVLITTLAVV